ncbi:MAG: helix-turn-helix transcriptional regulator [Clostridia bacterium]|nr:helix-turn-helix transcriptional regulator [Clostridia bacterium]
MVDYEMIGGQIKKLRINRKLTQEQLAEMVGVGPSHMSHIESGKTVPSFEVFIALVNALNCSSDELLCKEIKKAKPILNNWLVDLVADCDETEIKILSDMVVSMKTTLRKNKKQE